MFRSGLSCITSRFNASATTLETEMDTAMHKGCHDISFAKKPSRDKRTCQFSGILANLAGLQFKGQKGGARMVVDEGGGIRGVSA